jgi:glycosyltransferase involved in cell wall biosynthesis
MEAIQTRLNLGLSVILITKNEEKHLQACLESVRFADEIIVVDSGSTDRTVEIAQRFGAKVSQTSDWPGFGPQKNRALALATQPWVLSIDADERVTPELQAEIVQVMGANQYQAFEIPRLSNFCGKPIRHSGWWPDYVLRLFKREAGRFTDAPVHEKVETQVSVAKLKFWLLHDPYENLDALITKINRYSGEAAAAMAARGKRVGIPGLLGHSIWTFIRIYLIRRGFLDGRHGFVLAVAAASGSFFRYSKLMFLNRAKDQERKS